MQKTVLRRRKSEDRWIEVSKDTMRLILQVEYVDFDQAWEMIEKGHVVHTTFAHFRRKGVLKWDGTLA